MFKVGDEVYVKARIVRVDKADSKMPYEVRIDEILDGVWLSEDVVEKPKTYEQGLADAWELAKKVSMLNPEDKYNIFRIEDAMVCDILSDNTYEEALAKIEAYERKKEIKEKCIVESFDGSHKGVVTRVREKGDFFVLWDNGTADTYEQHEVKNTGKTAESLDSLLRQIGE